MEVEMAIMRILVDDPRAAPYGGRMKALLLALALTTTTLAQVPAAAPETGERILSKGIMTLADFKSYLLTTGKWTWDIGAHRGQTITFKADGIALHTELIMKYTVDAIGSVTVRHPNGTLAHLKFDKDFKSYSGAWNKTVPLSGKPVAP